MLRLDVTDVPITAARFTALDVPSNVRSLIDALVKWKRSHSLACVGPLPRLLSERRAGPLRLAARSQSARHNLAFPKVSEAGLLLRKELMNHAPPICMLISSRQFYCELVTTSRVINIHLVWRDISNITFPLKPKAWKCLFMQTSDLSQVKWCICSSWQLAPSMHFWKYTFSHYSLEIWAEAIVFQYQNINAHLNVGVSWWSAAF